jgi:hypothetical protein
LKGWTFFSFFIKYSLVTCLGSRYLSMYLKHWHVKQQCILTNRIIKLSKIWTLTTDSITLDIKKS